MTLTDYFDYKEGKLIVTKSTSSRRPTGQEIKPSVLNSGYEAFRFNKKTYLVHRAVWEIINGEIPDGYEIDHIDGDKTNNKIENLQLVTKTQNQRKRGLNAKGYCYNKTRQKWQAYIALSSKAINLGLFDTEKEAEAARKAAEKEYYIFEEVVYG